MLAQSLISKCSIAIGFLEVRVISIGLQEHVVVLGWLQEVSNQLRVFQKMKLFSVRAKGFLWPTVSWNGGWWYAFLHCYNCLYGVCDTL